VFLFGSVWVTLGDAKSRRRMEKVVKKKVEKTMVTVD